MVSNLKQMLTRARNELARMEDRHAREKSERLAKIAALEDRLQGEGRMAWRKAAIIDAGFTLDQESKNIIRQWAVQNDLSGKRGPLSWETVLRWIDAQGDVAYVVASNPLVEARQRNVWVHCPRCADIHMALAPGGLRGVLWESVRPACAEAVWTEDRPYSIEDRSDLAAWEIGLQDEGES